MGVFRLATFSKKNTPIQAAIWIGANFKTFSHKGISMLQPTPEEGKSQKKQIDLPMLQGHVIGLDFYGDGVLIVRCPSCGRMHRHGWTGEAKIEYRVSDCDCFDGYWVTLAPESASVTLAPESASVDDAPDCDLWLWSPVWDVEFPDGAIDDPLRLATLFRNKERNLIHWRGEFYRYRGPDYVRVDNDRIEADLTPFLKSQIDDDLEKEIVREIDRIICQVTPPPNLDDLITPPPTPIEESPPPTPLQKWYENIKRNLRAQFDEENEKKRKKITRTLMHDVLGCLRSLCHIDSGRDAPFWICDDEPFEPLFVAQNCIAYANRQGVFGIPPTPQFFTTNALDYAYDPHADCPLWLKFVDETLDIKSDSALALQEVSGYCVSRETSQQKIPFFVGASRGGKGVTARVITGIVGKQNVCNPTLAQLQGNFGLQKFLGKSLAIFGDSRFSGRDASVVVERLLSISGEDSLSVERKYQAEVTAKLKTRILMLSNELPRLPDASGTIANRFLVIQYTQSFLGREDPGLTEKLLAERPGILNWALCGLQRLREQRRFTEPKDSKEIVDEMKDLASPISAFIKECLEAGKDEKLPVADAYDCWKLWCDENGHRPSTRQVFGRDMQAAIPGLKRSKPKIGNVQVRCYDDWKLENEWEFSVFAFRNPPEKSK